jgi:hypothetical protein
MARTYTLADLNATTDAGKIARVRLAATIHDPPSLVDDAEILYLVGQHGETLAIAYVADICLGLVSQHPDEYEDDGGMKVKWTQQRVRHWSELAARIRTGAQNKPPMASTGPVSVGLIIDGMDGLNL